MVELTFKLVIFHVFEMSFSPHLVGIVKIYELKTLSHLSLM